MSSNHVGWVPPESRRSTLDIIWSCMTVFLVCTWKCTHLNVPSRAENEAGWYRFWIFPYWPERPLLRKLGRKLTWMAIIAIAPELGVGLALQQKLRAEKRLREVEGIRNPYWTMTHAFYADMGGLVLRMPQHVVPLRERQSSVVGPAVGGPIEPVLSPAAADVSTGKAPEERLDREQSIPPKERFMTLRDLGRLNFSSPWRRRRVSQSRFSFGSDNICPSREAGRSGRFYRPPRRRYQSPKQGRCVYQGLCSRSMWLFGRPDDSEGGKRSLYNTARTDDGSICPLLLRHLLLLVAQAVRSGARPCGVVAAMQTRRP